MITSQTTNAKNIKDAIVALISTPECNDSAIIESLYQKKSEEVIIDFYNWMQDISEITDRVSAIDLELLSNKAATFTLVKPQNITIGIICSTPDESEMNSFEVMDYFSDHMVDLIIYMPIHNDDSVKNISFDTFNNVQVINKNWLTSIIVEKNVPFFAQLGGRRYYKKGA